MAVTLLISMGSTRFWSKHDCKRVSNYQISIFLLDSGRCAVHVLSKGIQWYFWLLLFTSMLDLPGPSLSVMWYIKWKYFASLGCFLLLEYTTSLGCSGKPIIYRCRKSRTWKPLQIHLFSTFRRRMINHMRRYCCKNTMSCLGRCFLVLFCNSFHKTSNLSSTKILRFYPQHFWSRNVFLLSMTTQGLKLDWTHQKEKENQTLFWSSQTEHKDSKRRSGWYRQNIPLQQIHTNPKRTIGFCWN